MTCPAWPGMAMGKSTMSRTRADVGRQLKEGLDDHERPAARPDAWITARN
jgi:hypothetical protein